jgi:putative IMPACT (imprinted ancient) family translation regulator
MSYQVPAGQFENEYVVKKSRFIARVLPVASREEECRSQTVAPGLSGWQVTPVSR